jgi:hypothetical protein
VFDISYKYSLQLRSNVLDKDNLVVLLFFQRILYSGLYFLRIPCIYNYMQDNFLFLHSNEKVDKDNVVHLFCFLHIHYNISQFLNIIYIGLHNQSKLDQANWYHIYLQDNHNLVVLFLQHMYHMYFSHYMSHICMNMDSTIISIRNIQLGNHNLELCLSVLYTKCRNFQLSKSCIYMNKANILVLNQHRRNLAHNHMHLVLCLQHMFHNYLHFV